MTFDERALGFQLAYLLIGLCYDGGHNKKKIKA
jgi:hypothetical protein